MKGLEPILLTEPDPKSGAATNYATSADFFEGAKIQKFLTPNINNEKYYFLTFKASRRALPMSMKASTNSMIAMPGSMAKYASFKMIYA